MSTATAAVFTRAGAPLELREFPVQSPLPGTALLTLERSGICGTDLHILAGRLPIPPPFIPGHEFIGRIAALGAGATSDALGARLQSGDLAIACVAQPCGTCPTCAAGETASCLHFGVTNLRDPALAPHLFGGFATALHHPAANLVRVPDGLDLDAVAAFPCAGPTAIRAIAYAGGIAAGELVVVQGTGPVGLCAIALASRAGATVVAIGSGTQPRRIALARELGAQEVWDYRAVPAAERARLVRGLAGERGGADVVVEASGAPGAIPEGLELLRIRGRYLIPGQYSSSGPVAIRPELITFKALRLIGSGQYTTADIAAYLALIARHPDLARTFAGCITHRYPVAEAARAIADADAGLAVKAVFAP